MALQKSHFLYNYNMNNNANKLLESNQIIGHSTDTVYALIGRVERNNISKINKLKRRNLEKPLQILFYDFDDVLKIIECEDEKLSFIKKNLNNNISFIARVNEEFEKKNLIKSFNGTIMFRIPKGEIKEVLKKEKMLFATSANLTNERPVLDKNEFNLKFPAISSFGSETTTKSSTIIDLTKKEMEIIRE